MNIMIIEQFPPLQEFIHQKWSNFSDFSSSLNEKKEPLFFEGEGLLIIHTNIKNFLFEDLFYLFSINDSLYVSALKEDRNTRLKYFDGIFHVDNSLINSSVFREAKQDNHSTRYKKFASKILVDCKSYAYENEYKLLFSQANKVDLLYSHQLLINTDNTSIKLKVQSYPSLKKVIEWQKMVDQVNMKTEEFLAERSKK